MASAFAVALVALQFGLTTANDATCILDDIQVQDNFDLKKYLGKWYEIYWILPFDINDPFTDYNHVYEEVNSTHFVSHITGRSYEGKCFYNDVHFEIIGNSKFIKIEDSDKPFWVLKTDYDNYSATYGCDEKFENGTCNKARGWIWSRNKSMSLEHFNQAKNALESACIPTSELLKTKQTNRE
ncbi:hypothetical protein LOTGIDRAFT_156771 [Lottia gigantea]|uniref:Lipocalin/cytosolic fatty-acid binding domain-containing protein n=1 Tax=Lottia gigantea TaxID=225164 RepID=V4AYR8_LOTGI|nr:hypothetical protein LOTGIDRAFT_156771 [Lottia gigantea]ESP02823.1 hypothetical protein LOTGIDRAFT_156771 [Lottia gigantea]